MLFSLSGGNAEVIFRFVRSLNWDTGDQQQDLDYNDCMNPRRFLSTMLQAGLVCSCFAFPTLAQNTTAPAGSDDLFLTYEPSETFPFGRLHPQAPPETTQYAFMIGEWSCDEQRRRPGEPWQTFPSKMVATYFLNGYGIRNYTYMPTAAAAMTYAYDLSNEVWQITNVTAPDFRPTEWVGRQEGDTMIAETESVGPQGTPVTLRITFFNMTSDGYEWRMEAVTPQGPFLLRTKICAREA